MALMKHREPNQARWVGVRPAHRGTHINKFERAFGDTKIVHTVDGAKTFYLKHFTLSMAASAVVTFYFFIRDAADLNPVNIFHTILQNNQHAEISGCFPDDPYEIPSSYDICCESDNVTSAINAFIHGWEE